MWRRIKNGTGRGVNGGMLEKKRLRAVPQAIPDTEHASGSMAKCSEDASHGSGG